MRPSKHVALHLERNHLSMEKEEGRWGVLAMVAKLEAQAKGAVRTRQMRRQAWCKTCVIGPAGEALGFIGMTREVKSQPPASAYAPHHFLSPRSLVGRAHMAPTTTFEKHAMWLVGQIGCQLSQL